MIAPLSRALSRMAFAFAGFGLVGVTAIIGWQVFARYVLNASPAWSEQAALVLMVYFVLFAAAAGVREGFHIRLSMAADQLPPALARLSRIGADLVVAAFGLALAVYGGQLVAATWSHTVPTLGIPRGLVYLPISAAGALMAFFSLEQILARLTGKTVAPLWN